MGLPPGLERRNGTYIVRYKAAGRWTRKTVGKDLEQALEAHSQLRGQEDTSHAAPPEPRRDAHLARCIKVWLDHQRARNKAKTIKDARLRSTRLLRHLGDVRISRISGEQLDRFIAARRQDGVQAATINCDLRILRALLRFAKAEGHVDEIPRIRLLKAPKRKIVTPFAPDEIERVMRNAEPRVRAILAVAGTSGLRLDEILHLQWRDVDLRDALVHVREKTYERRLRDGSLVDEHWCPKSHQARTVSIPSEAVAELRQFRMQQKYSADADWVFQSRSTRRRLTNAAKLIREAFQWAGVYEPGRLTHAVRHTVATRMLQNGMDLETVRDVLGHESVTTTELYLHTTAERRRQAARAGSLLKTRR